MGQGVVTQQNKWLGCWWGCQSLCCSPALPASSCTCVIAIVSCLMHAACWPRCPQEMMGERDRGAATPATIAAAAQREQGRRRND